MVSRQCLEYGLLKGTRKEKYLVFHIPTVQDNENFAMGVRTLRTLRTSKIVD